MLTTPHALTGTVIGVALGNPILAFVGGLASHYALDAIPHTDPGTFHYGEKEPVRFTERDYALGWADLSLTLGLLLWLSGTTPIVTMGVLFGVVGSIFPDALVLLRILFPKFASLRLTKQYFAWTEKYHKTTPPSQIILGIVTQAAVIGLALWYLLAL